MCDQRVSGAKASLAEAAEKAAEKRWETRDRGETTAIGGGGHGLAFRLSLVYETDRVSPYFLWLVGGTCFYFSIYIYIYTYIYIYI